MYPANLIQSCKTYVCGRLLGYFIRECLQCHPIPALPSRRLENNLKASWAGRNVRFLLYRNRLILTSTHQRRIRPDPSSRNLRGQYLTLRESRESRSCDSIKTGCGWSGEGTTTRGATRHAEIVEFGRNRRSSHETNF